MPFAVTTVNDEVELAALLQATVTTLNSEDELDATLAAVTNIGAVVCKGGKYTVIDDISIVNVSVRVLAKGGKFTAIVETA